MMRFLNPKESLFLRIMGQLGLECKPDNKTFFLDWGKNSNYVLKNLQNIGTYHMMCSIMPEWTTLILEVTDLTSSLKASFGNETKACGRKTEE